MLTMADGRNAEETASGCAQGGGALVMFSGYTGDAIGIIRCATPEPFSSKVLGMQHQTFQSNFFPNE